MCVLEGKKETVLLLSAALLIFPHCHNFDLYSIVPPVVNFYLLLTKGSIIFLILTYARFTYCVLTP